MCQLPNVLLFTCSTGYKINYHFGSACESVSNVSPVYTSDLILIQNRIRSNPLTCKRDNTHYNLVYVIHIRDVD